MASFSFRTPAHIRFGRGEADKSLGALARLGRRVLVVRSRSVSFADALVEGFR
jgi:alcohol dehydrogenase YqhD (iron-dependent ADH family)